MTAPAYTLHHGDALQVLQTLPSESVHVCITSPPYYSLRDYQTATWDGGDPDCDHVAPSRFDYKLNSGLGPTGVQTQASNAGSGSVKQYRDVCGKCGARRVDQQIGLEQRPEDYVARLVEVFREVRRVLHKTGTVWLNLGSSYSGSGGAGGDYNEGGLREGQPRYAGRSLANFKPKDMIPIPWMVAMALQQDGWWLRADIIWHKRAPMPASVRDRPTPAHEYVFLLAKSASYYYDATAIREPMSEATKERDKHSFGGAFKGQFKGTPSEERWQDGRPIESPKFYNEAGRNKRSVWTLGPEPYHAAHFAVMPTKLVEPCILAGSSAHGCCSQCLAPWQRVTEVERPVPAAIRPKDPRTHLGHSSKSTINQSNWHDDRTPSRTITTLGWQPTCDCQVPAPGGSRVLVTPDPVPCTVLDPFAGASTVGVVALKHHRHFVGIDLNAEYLKLSEQRLGRVQPTLLELTA